MTAVLMWLRAEARRRWRGWLTLAVLFGIAGGAAIAAASGARRTQTAYPRLLAWADAPDTFTGGVFGDRDDVAMYREVMTIPQAARASLSYAVPCPVRGSDGVARGFTDVAASTAPPGVHDRYKVKLLTGRALDPTRADEATLSFAGRRPGMNLGHTVAVALDERCAEYVPVRIVGIHAGPGEFPAVGGFSFPGLILSPAFYTAHREGFEAQQPSNVLSVELWLKPGVSVQDVKDELARRDLDIEIPFSTADHVAGVQRSMRFESGALWALGGLLALASLAILGQAIARESSLASVESPRLRALGVSVNELTMAGVTRAAGIGAVAAGVAAGTAIALSPLTPLGLARVAEPDPGLWVDGPAIAGGAIAVLLAIVAVSVVPSWRAARSNPDQSGPASARPSRIAGGLARASAGPSAVAGVRFAFEPGRGRTAVPTRSAIAGLAMGVAAMIVAATFGSSMNNLLGSPRLQGFTWDALADGDPSGERMLRDDPRFTVAAGGVLGVEIEGRETTALVIEAGRGLEPVVVEGRQPYARAEVALASKTLRDAGVRIGDSVALHTVPLGQSCSRESATIRATVVGRAIVPPFGFFPHQPGEGAVLSEATAHELIGGPGFDPDVGCSQLVAFGPGMDRDRTIQEIGNLGMFVLPRVPPAAFESLGRLRDVPFGLAAVLGLLAIASLFHALATSVRRRAPDLAILRTIGFVGGQVRATIAWQATAIALAALLVGVPVGIAAGRWGWIAFAEQLAVVPEAVVAAFIHLGGLTWWTGSIWFIAGIVVLLVVLANVIAALPGRAAARTRPAVILRSE